MLMCLFVFSSQLMILFFKFHLSMPRKFIFYQIFSRLFKGLKITTQYICIHTYTELQRKLTNKSKVIYKNNKRLLQILKAISIKNKQLNINKIAFNTSTNILNIFNNSYTNQSTPTINKHFQPKLNKTE